ncbi:MAG: T9SS type A sorting domain-containing protein, partial [Bacteroidota bacterium]
FFCDRLWNANSENHENMKFSIFNVIVALLFMLSCEYSHAQDCVKLYFDSNKDGDELVVQLKVGNFDNILISQFAITYDYSNLELISIQGNTDIELDQTHVFSEIPGYISVSWSNPSVGQSLADGNSLLEMRFTEIISDVSTFAIDPNFDTEFFNAFFEEVCLDATSASINETRTQLVGKLYHDLNGNCIADATDFPLSGWTVFIDGGLEQYYRITDKFGYYTIPVEIGTYTIEVLEPSDLWVSCEAPIIENVIASGEIIENSFVISPNNSSSALEVAVSSSEIQICSNNIYSIRYKNNGTALAQSAIIEFHMDENLDYVSTNTGNFSIDDNLITFDLGSIRPGDGGEFQVVLSASCDNIEVGQTICVDAEISSSDIVIPPVDWGGAILTTKATCEDDSVAFTIQNIGSSPMSNSIQSIVVEDDVMFGSQEVLLDLQEEVKLKYPSTGGVYRILIDQEDGYPLSNFTTDFIESCNGVGTNTYRFVSMFQNDDESPYLDIQCQEVIDATEENRMSAFPVGYREQHFINQNEDIEYTIHFENPDMDTVYNIWIGNRVDESLDLETLVAGPSSHDYTFSIIDERRLRIDFKNIQLPSTEIDPIRSRGFVKFRISQKENLPLGTQITSASIIFFDLKDGIETNEVSHIVGEEFIEVVINTVDLLSEEELVVAPNPATSLLKIEVPAEYKDLSYMLYDTKGSVMSAASVLTNAFYIQRDFLQSGMYFLELRSANKKIGTKKIVFQD